MLATSILASNWTQEPSQERQHCDFLLADPLHTLGIEAAIQYSMPSEATVLDDIIYARVLITLQRMQLDEQDRKLREHLGDIVGTSPKVALMCQDSLKRAWFRASESLAVDEQGAFNSEFAA